VKKAVVQTTFMSMTPGLGRELRTSTGRRMFNIQANVKLKTMMPLQKMLDPKPESSGCW